MIRTPMEGRFFGRLLVMVRCENIGPFTAYLCLCRCGAEVKVRGMSLRRGDTRSCGCYRKEELARLRTTHGRTDTPTYRSWASMHARCTDVALKAWKDYGGRGIAVCDRWNAFENFLVDMGERPEGRSLDRIDNDGNYEPGNCRWATRKQQSENKRPMSVKMKQGPDGRFLPKGADHD